MDTTAFDARPAAALLFDLDGTLVDSMPAVQRAWTTWAVEFGLTEADFARTPLHGRPAREIAADLVGPDRADEGLRRIEELEVADLDGVVPLPGTHNLLAELPAARWAVVTSGTGRLARARMRAAGIVPPALVTADDITRGKPDPEPYLLGAARLGVDPADCVVVEDAPAGLAAARAAGMRAIAVVTTHRADELDADAVVPDLSHVKAEPVDGGLRLTFATA